MYPVEKRMENQIINIVEEIEKKGFLNSQKAEALFRKFEMLKSKVEYLKNKFVPKTDLTTAGEAGANVGGGEPEPKPEGEQEPIYKDLRSAYQQTFNIGPEGVEGFINDICPHKSYILTEYDCIELSDIISDNKFSINRTVNKPRPRNKCQNH